MKLQIDNLRKTKINEIKTSNDFTKPSVLSSFIYEKYYLKKHWTQFQTPVDIIL